MVDEGAKTISISSLDAFIFDMDGVITNTAVTHAAAWKKMFDEFLVSYSIKVGKEYEPFDSNLEYLRFVDGKPRYDGARSFLESRGINLPYGELSDEPGKETICGLGNLKDKYFIERLNSVGVESFPSTIEFIETLKNRGIKTAVISASRNATEVLSAAGVIELFEVKVDGIDSDRMSLKGKPDPAIFLEAARRLGVRPDKSAVVEDALSGVEAGEKGKFKLVIGIDRGQQTDELMERGADIVVNDLSQLSIKGGAKRKIVPNLPSALSEKETIFSQISDRTVALFLDYDGTITPIVKDPNLATISQMTRNLLERLSKYYPVSFISGRDLSDIKNMVGIGDIAYAGSHGFDISGPSGMYRNQEMGTPFIPALDKAEEELKGIVNDFPGAWVERKLFAIAVHFRNAKKSDEEPLSIQFDKVLSHYKELKKSIGKKVFEARPNIDWDKGKALFHMMKVLFSDVSRILPVYIGDDTTDEDAFRALSGRGIGIVVGTEYRETAALYSLKDPDEAIEFIRQLVAFSEDKVSRGVWTMSYNNYIPEQEGLREALCTLGNGYFATRGAAPESAANEIHYPATYAVDVYNRVRTDISDRTIEDECLVNLPNWLPLKIKIEDNDWFELDNVSILDYQQDLDIEKGILTRLVRFSDKAGRVTRIFQRRLVSMASEHLAGLETSIAAENWSGKVTVHSALDGRVTNSGVERYRALNSRHLLPVSTGTTGNDSIHLSVETNQSRIRISQAARTRIFRNESEVFAETEFIEEPGYIAQESLIELEEGEVITVEKIVSMFTSKDSGISESSLEARKQLERTPDFEEILDEHVLSWDHLWNSFRISISDNQRAAMILHLHVFHLLQTASLNIIDRDASVPARGLHGEAYRGHIFWDEIFIFPLLNMRMPEITRALLLYRYRRLSEAKWAAKQAGYEGAMFPWQSGSDGREESQKIHLNPRSGRWIPDHTHLQHHINIAIAYNIWQYYQVSNDSYFLSFYGTELLVEIARFWASKVSYDRSIGRYEIKKVIGPDEFHDAYPDSETPGIDNNAYTNVMVVWVLCRTIDAIQLLSETQRKYLQERLSLTPEEYRRWEDISRKMYVPFHDDNIISQFQGYDELEELDWEAYEKKYRDIHRMDRILEAEGKTPNRYKLSKQADVLMLFYLLTADELDELFRRLGYPFDGNMIPRNIEYYLKRTSHGSTLSRVVHAWVLARSKRELSWHLFKEALESDISDTQGGTTKEGIHLGAMAGTVDLVQRCYTGIETRENLLIINPHLPKELKEVQFSILYRQIQINMQFTPERVVIRTNPVEVPPITIQFQKQLFRLNPGDALTLEYRVA